MVKNNQKGFVGGFFIGVVVVLLVLVGGYVTFMKTLKKGSEPVVQQTTQTPKDENSNWKQNVYSQFKNLTDWKVNEDIKTWRLTDLSETDRDNLKNFEQGKIFEFRKTFNDEQSLSGGNAVENLKQLNISEKMLEDSVRKVLVDNKWSFVAGPSEGSFYHDYMYVYERHPLILQIGTRDAVLGGMYISIQFQY